ncbi:MAG TPA: type VI secretion system baseplate subunit TssF [Blastocatellia bacterium]|jgi:type VI secretion system protein ImpG|nr:type VI secretion system baseplate subunit TssF [Blastocatellia bacterium]
MRDELLGYYERELIFLRQMGAEFAEKYPKIAGRLLLEPDKCEDPHVERMIEAFAFLAGRIHLKLDDELPEITEAFLNVLYPHYLAPIPSMSIAKFSLDPAQGKLSTAYEIGRGTILYSRPIHGAPCRFRTAYPVTLWPVEVVSGAYESLDPMSSRGRWETAEIRIGMRCVNGVKLSQLKAGQEQNAPALDRLRFYLSGEAQLVYPMYEAIFNNAVNVEIRPKASGRGTRKMPSRVMLPASSLKPVGFESDESMLGYTARSFPGYRLLSEYFAFPEKFLFFDVTGLGEAVRAGFGEAFEIVIHVRNVAPPRAQVKADTFQLGCAPIVNLFRKVAEPIDLTHQQLEYRVIPDIHQQMGSEIYSVDSVYSVAPNTEVVKEFQPFYSFGHSYERDQASSFWYATRRSSPRKDDQGTDVYISFVDLNFNLRMPGVETVTVGALCTNRDLPGQLPFGSREGDFEVENAGPLSRVRCLRKPTDTFRPPMRRGAHWRLISHLTLNRLSLVDEHKEGAPEALREILLLYDFMDSAATRKHIRGIDRVSSRRVVRQTGSRIGTGFVRGVETTIDFDETQYVGSGVFLFASVLERFLGLYASVNSFNQLVARTKQREGELRRWTPRAGDQILL